MSKKSFEEIKNSLTKVGYNFKDFNIVKIGDYPPDDSDWNYKDVTHAEKIHDSIYSRLNTAVSSDFQLAIDTLVLFGFKFPVSLVQYEYAKYNIFYYTTFGPFVILTKTIIESHENNKSKTTSNFSIGSMGIFKIFHPLIKKIIYKNNQSLMEDDMPMRNRRGFLRKENHLFYKETETYTFESTANIKNSNIFLKPGIKNYVSILKTDIISAKEGQIVGNKNGILSFFITHEKDNIKKLWPTTCPHEGAHLTRKCINNNAVNCPWHNRKINSILKIDLDNKIDFMKNMDFACKDNGDNIIIKFRNDPLYYKKKPLEYFSYDN